MRLETIQDIVSSIDRIKMWQHAVFYFTQSHTVFARLVALKPNGRV